MICVTIIGDMSYYLVVHSLAWKREGQALQKSESDYVKVDLYMLLHIFQGQRQRNFMGQSVSCALRS